MKYSSNLIPDCGLQEDNYLSQERHIWRGEGRGGAGLVMAATGNRRKEKRFSGEAYLARRGEGRCGAGDGRDWKQKEGEEVPRIGIFGEERGGAGWGW